MDELNISKVEEVSTAVAEQIESGNTELAVFSPLEAAVKEVESFVETIVIKPASELTDEDQTSYKKLRTGIRKVLKIVEDQRKSVTKKLDEIRKGYIGKEKEMVSKLKEKEELLKKILDEKKELEEKEMIEAMVPERKEKVELAGLEFTEEELRLKPEAFNELYTIRVEEKLRREKEERERKEREEQIRKEAEEKARADERRRIEEERKVAPSEAVAETTIQTTKKQEQIERENAINYNEYTKAQNSQNDTICISEFELEEIMDKHGVDPDTAQNIISEIKNGRS